MSGTIKLTCGHFTLVPSYMGRGEQRKKRLAHFSSQVCLDCAVLRLRQRAMKLTLVNGTKYTPSQQAAYVERRIGELSQPSKI